MRWLVLSVLMGGCLWGQAVTVDPGAISVWTCHPDYMCDGAATNPPKAWANAWVPPDHQQPPNLNQWKASVLALSAASVLDTLSSWGGQELNPVLGRGRFGLRQAGIKSALIGTTVLTEWLWLRKHPDTERVFVNLNVGASALVVGVAINNFKTH